MNSFVFRRAVTVLRLPVLGAFLLLVSSWACDARLAPLPVRPPLVTAAAGHGFPLAADKQAAAIVYDRQDAALVGHAANDLADDLASVTGVRPQVAGDGLAPSTGKVSGRAVVVVGTLGRNRDIDRWVTEKKLRLGDLRGAWESFVIAIVPRPAPGIDQALVIVGSDRRGTAYGVYELAEAMGVSPWSWWADVTPRHRPVLTVPAGTRRFGPPSIKYRGIFINDEDWGLFPWAARTFDPDRGNFGPKTYRRVFELLLRLKANTLWPAMHRTSAPFNADPADARLADEYGIVMGSSHAEPMLRDNVGEWKGPADGFNYAANPAGVRAYWEERVRSNAGFESLWTLGMRGIHDSGIVGATTTPDRVKLLDRIITDQRDLLRRHVKPDLTQVPQMFVPYKEVLELYRNGLTVPDDVTLVWPDDNFGYIRQFPTDAERARGGGSGVYYHLSYLGAPLAYLWLSTTPPALVQEEMTRAYDRGMRSVWIANVGDIKPAEINISQFMALAWDVERWRGRSQRDYLDDWAGRTFGTEQGRAIGGILDGYYRLNFERRPEHLQRSSRGGRGQSATPAERDARLRRFATLVADAAAAQAHIPADLQDAFFELVDYPVRAAAGANRRFFAAERYAELIDGDPVMARSVGAAAVYADQEIATLTRRYNEDIAGGKWRYIMAPEPADPQWQGFRTAPVALPAPGLVSDPALFLAAVARADLSPPAGIVEAEFAHADAQWRKVDGLGRGEGSLVAKAPGARLSFVVVVPEGGAQGVDLGLLPLFPDAGDASLHLDVAVDGGAPRRIDLPRQVERQDWSQAVLDNLLRLPIIPALSPGRHEVTVTARSTGLAVDRLMLTGTAPPAAH